MGEQTGISWTDHTFNPWWGCHKIAPECKNCYADSTAHRYVSQFGELWGRTAARRFFGDTHWKELAKWNRKAISDGVRRRVFVGSMCDWAEVHADPAIAAQMNEARRGVSLQAMGRRRRGRHQWPTAEPGQATAPQKNPSADPRR